jgi:hypothetical protein
MIRMWLEEGRELVIMAGPLMFVIGPVTLSITWRERGFLLHPRASCWF